MLGPLLKVQTWFCVASARDSASRQKWAKRQGSWGFCSISKNDGRRGTFEEDLEKCISRGRPVQETCSSEMLGGQGADFLRVAFWSIRSSGLLRWFCVTGAALRMSITFSQYFDRRSGKNAKRIGTRPSALHSTFHFWRMSRRIASFLMLSTWKLKKSRRISLFLTLPRSKLEEVSKNSFVFKFAERQIDRQTDR